MKLYMHGWNSAGGFWHGPTDIATQPRRVDDILRRLGKSAGSFSGRLRCRVPGSLPADFQTTAYDLGDAGVALIHLDGEGGGPIGALAVLPANRRAAVRKEFGFGFAAFLGFFGGLVPAGSELAIDEYVENVLRTESPSSVVFTIESANVCPETEIVLSAFLEKLSVAMLHWLSAADAAREAVEEDSAGSYRPSGEGLYANL